MNTSRFVDTNLKFAFSIASKRTLRVEVPKHECLNMTIPVVCVSLVGVPSILLRAMPLICHAFLPSLALLSTFHRHFDP